MKQVFFLLSLLLIFSCKERVEEKKTQKSNRIDIKTLKDVNVASGSIERIKNFPSAFIKTRPIDVWLPDNYPVERKYAVLYMHDGQMLFDSTKTWNKQEWKVDEIGGQLQKEGETKPFIVVAIHNISEIRWNDYFPAKAMDYVSKEDKKQITALANRNMANTDLYADNYLKFLTKELKPFIDKTYAVLTDKENTAIAGSSMGGLISMYAVSEYPKVFGSAACISTHWPGAGVSKDNPLPDAIFAYMKDKLPEAGTHRWYFDYGDKTLDQYYPQYATRVDEIMTAKGYSNANFLNKFFEGADHSENSWNKRLDVPFTFLLGN